MVSNPAAFHPRSKEQLSSCFTTSDIEPTCGTEREPDTISVPKLCQVSPTDTRSDLIALTVRHGARTPIGHRASPLSSLVMLKPANAAHATRIARIAARLTAEMGGLVASGSAASPMGCGK